MIAPPEAFALLSLPNASLSGSDISTETGVLNLECVTVPHPESTKGEDCDVYLVLRLNIFETPIDPARVVTRTDDRRTRTYTFANTPSDPGQLTLSVKVPFPEGTDIELAEKLETFDSILEQYVAEFHGPSANVPSIAPVAQGQTAGIGAVNGNKDLRGHLIVINEDTGEVIGEVEDKFRIKEDPAMFEKGHENDPVVIEVSDAYTRVSDANALEAFASIIPPDQQNWISKSASIISTAISMTTNLLLTTVTTGSSYYIAHSAASPHHPAAGTPSNSKGSSPVPPLPPRALVFLTSERTRKGLSTVHALSGEAVKVSTRTVALIDSMIRRAMGAKPKRTKYFATGVPPSGSNPSLLSPGGPPLPPRTPSPTPSRSGFAPPPPYAPAVVEKSSSLSAEKPSLPPRRTPSPAPPLPARAGTSAAGALTQPPPLPERRLKTKDHILISADLILSTIDDSTRRILDVGTEQIGKVVNHKYGPEAAQSSLLMAGTARNVGLVYVDMRGIGRRALLRRVGKTFVKAAVSSSKEENQPQVVKATSPPPK
ncbi:hypothetical protein BDZ97DRAFT_1755350 [Flammula alnicola]|nr:hypothetical protein BDZ97DRAFT_1755350 [Flammula alnicola]